jgi:tetratricopeptide (TPR) repeat protein
MPIDELALIMSQEIEGMISRAEKLRHKRKGIMGMFSKPDYFESADIFVEIGKKCNDMDMKEKYLNEAIKTLTIEGSEYAYFRIAEVYRHLMDLDRNDAGKLRMYMEEYAKALEVSERYLMAGQAYSKLGDLVGEENPKDGIGNHGKAVEMFEKDGGCPYHIQDVRKKCLLLQLGIKDYEGAYKTLKYLTITFSKLCRQILCIILEKPLEEDPENDLVMVLINKGHEEGVEALKKFKVDHYLPKYVELIFQLAEEKLSPENDIC